jgi:hypothetical protein
MSKRVFDEKKRNDEAYYRILLICGNKSVIQKECFPFTAIKGRTGEPPMTLWQGAFAEKISTFQRK